MGRSLEGNLGASEFVALLDKARSAVYRRLVARFGDEQLADEMSTHCMAEAWEKWLGEPTYFRAADLAGWLCRRAEWQAIDRLRQRGRLAPLPEEHEGEESVAGWAGSGVRPRRESDTPTQARDKERLLASLERLPRREREALSAYHFEERSDQDVGGELFGDEGTPQARGLRVWRLRRKGYTHLRALLLENGVDPHEWGGPGTLAV